MQSLSTHAAHAKQTCKQEHKQACAQPHATHVPTCDTCVLMHAHIEGMQPSKHASKQVYIYIYIYHAASMPCRKACTKNQESSLHASSMHTSIFNDIYPNHACMHICTTAMPAPSKTNHARPSTKHVRSWSGNYFAKHSSHQGDMPACINSTHATP